MLTFFLFFFFFSMLQLYNKSFPPKFGVDIAGGWIAVACGSHNGKICCAVCSLGTLREVIAPPRSLPLIHKPREEDVRREGGRKNFNVRRNLVTGGRESEKTSAAYLHFWQHYRSRQVSSEWNMSFSKIISRKTLPW